MILGMNVGNLIEPLSGRRWGKERIWKEYCSRLAFFSGRGLSDGDVVFVHYGNKLEFFVDLLAIWTLGGCVVPIDPRLTKFEVETLAKVALPRLSLWAGDPEESVAASVERIGTAVVDSSVVPHGGRWHDVAASSRAHPYLDEPALILFTSGTTGNPKGVVHTHRSLQARWTSLRESLGLADFRRTLCLLPTNFGHGLICNCLFPWLAGHDLYVLPSFNPEVVVHLGELIDENGITFMSSVPSVWRLALKMAKAPRLRSLRRICCGSAPLTAHLWGDIQAWAGIHEVINSYGITETASWAAGTTVPDFRPEDGLIGNGWGANIKILGDAGGEHAPMSIRECRPGEAGYVWLNTPALMRGYLGRDDLTRKVVSFGWFFTGDIGYIDDRGLLFLTGREREEINKGGMKVYPTDIDAVAERWGRSVDVCTFGFADELLGENVGIAFVLETPSEDNLRNFVLWLKDNLGTHQLPTRWYLLSEIPRNSRGKVNRSVVATRCESLRPIDLRALLGPKRESL